jgi:hypothetical protein
MFFGHDNARKCGQASEHVQGSKEPIHLLGIRMDEPSSHYNDFLASSIGEGVRV